MLLKVDWGRAGVSYTSLHAEPELFTEKNLVLVFVCENSFRC